MPRMRTRPLVGIEDTGYYLQEGAFASAVPSNDPQDLALLDLQTDIVQGFEFSDSGHCASEPGWHIP